MERVINSSVIRISILFDVIYAVSCIRRKIFSSDYLDLVIFEITGRSYMI
jgi:hypothetical protein